MKILICDDETPNRDAWLEQVSAALPQGSASPRPLGEPKAAFKELFARQSAKRAGHDRADIPCAFDGQDVLVVDYDLVMVDPEAARHTGEELARLCRLFSDVGYIVILNQGNRTVDFDLRMSTRPRSHADLNIASRTVGQHGLWRAGPANGFRPWIWDDVSAVVATRRQLAKKIADKSLEISIADLLEIPDVAISAMTDEAFEYLNQSAKSVEQFRRTTFIDFLGQQVESKEADGLIRNSPRRAATWAVARTAKWLSRQLLGPQEILVDVPHLIERLPFLMDPTFGPVTDPATWAKLPAAGIDAVIEPVRSATSFAASVEWFGKATFWWPLIDAHPAVRELRSTFSPSNVPSLVFAEDRSTFVNIEDASEFRNDHHNRFSLRWVKPVDGLIYEPRRRLLGI
jgi:hypothetical protein